jgi:cysteine sulfinate desulfinase/cysteine desulfurase-like protein
MGVPDAEANALVRLSFGRDNTVGEIERIAGILPEVIRRSRG